jgi:dUTP pyrophosphatase
MARKSKIELKVYKAHKEASLPEYATDSSSCFDLLAHIPLYTIVNIYNGMNQKIAVISKEILSQARVGIVLKPNDRALIPTGLIFDIPTGYDLRVHPRSGLSWKSGLTLSNCEGIIDNDYTKELFISIKNSSAGTVAIGHGDKIAQCEITPVISKSMVSITETKSKIKQKTNRVGGFGSTGS